MQQAKNMGDNGFAGMGKINEGEAVGGMRKWCALDMYERCGSIQ